MGGLRAGGNHSLVVEWRLGTIGEIDTESTSDRTWHCAEESGALFLGGIGMTWSCNDFVQELADIFLDVETLLGIESSDDELPRTGAAYTETFCKTVAEMLQKR